VGPGAQRSAVSKRQHIPTRQTVIAMLNPIFHLGKRTILNDVLCLCTNCSAKSIFKGAYMSKPVRVICAMLIYCCIYATYGLVRVKKMSVLKILRALKHDILLAHILTGNP